VAQIHALLCATIDLAIVTLLLYGVALPRGLGRRQESATKKCCVAIWDFCERRRTRRKRDLGLPRRHVNAAGRGHGITPARKAEKGEQMGSPGNSESRLRCASTPYKLMERGDELLGDRSRLPSPIERPSIFTTGITSAPEPFKKHSSAT